MKKRLLLNTFTSLISQIVAVVCGFVLPRLILSQYGSDVNGLTQSIKQFLSIISFLELGIGQVIQTALYKPLAEKDRIGLSCILASGSKFFRRIAGALIVYIMVLMVGYPTLINHNYDWVYTVTLIGVMGVGTFAQYYFGLIDIVLLSADQRGYIPYSWQIISVLLNTVLCAVMIYMGASIHMVKLLTSVVYLIKPVMVRLYIKKHYQIDRKINYEGEPIKQKWNGIAQHISAIVLDGTDTIVLTVCSTLTNVSIYSVYFMVISGVQQFFSAATTGIQSMIGSLWAKQDKKELYQVFSVVEIGLHLATVFLFSCMGVLIVPFVRVYTNGLTDANYIQPVFATVLVLAYGIRCLRTPYNILIMAGGHYKQTQICHITAATLNLLISIVGVLFFGLVGVALGTVVAMGYQTLWMMIYNSRKLLQWPLSTILKQLAADVVGVLLICFGSRWVQLGAATYGAWIVMAVKVCVMALVAIMAVGAVFYGKSLYKAFCWYREKKCG